jgi:hypothetical protein
LAAAPPTTTKTLDNLEQMDYTVIAQKFYPLRIICPET